MKRRSLLGTLASIPFISIAGCSSSEDLTTEPVDDTTENPTKSSSPIVVDVFEVDGAIERGQPTATYAIGNPASESVYAPVKVIVDGSVVQEKDVTIEPESVETFSATWFDNSDGAGHESKIIVQAWNATTEERVTIQSPVYPSIHDVTWVDEENVEVTYGAVNEGSARESTTVELRSDQVPSESHEVTLDSGESVEFTDTLRAYDGNIRVSVATDISLAKKLTAYCQQSG